LNSSSAYLIVSHGSRDPRPQVAVEALAQLIRQQLQHRQSDRVVPPLVQPVPVQARPQARLPTRTSTSSLINAAGNPLVGTATLELAKLSLHEQIQQFGDRALAAGYRTLKLLPLFLLPGTHVMEDIPAEVAIARQCLDCALTLELRPYLGSHPQLRNLLSETALSETALSGVTLETALSGVTSAPDHAQILLAHGSRRPGANQSVEAIANDLQALPAYWSVPPNLETQIAALTKTGCQQITIMPYFLFAGGIMDAIAQSIQSLSQQFPATRLHLAKPLGVSSAMADLVVDLAVSH
jgi:sirohydrochlorin cobaltochelatase